MDPLLVIDVIRAAVRLGTVSAEAIGQYSRDRAVLLPKVESIDFPTDVLIRAHFTNNPELVTQALKPYWDSFRLAASQPLVGSRDILAAAYASSLLAQQVAIGDVSNEAVGYWMVKQWGKSGPVGPFARVVLVMADVALEFAARDPSLLSVHGRGEVIVKALALHLSELIPDNVDELGPRNQLGTTLAGIFLRGSLQALEENPDLVVEDEHIQQLIKNTLPNLIDELPDNNTLDQYRWRNLIEALLGPISKIAVQTLGEHPEAFFSQKFAEDSLLGTLMRVFLLKVADLGLHDTLTKAGTIDLWHAVLGLAERHPDLFLGSPEKDAEKFISAVFSGLASTLAQCSPPFEKETLIRLTVTAFDTLSKDIGLWFDPNTPWEQVASQSLAAVLGALHDGFQANGQGAIKYFRSSDMLTEFVQIVLTQATRTPGMLGNNPDEMKHIVNTVVSVMSADKSVLLSKNDWLLIATVLIEEAAANPARLFAFKDGATASDVALPVIQSLLKVATDQWRQHGRDGGAVLFGATLRDAITIAIRAVSGNAKAALQNVALLEQLAQSIGAVVVATPGRFGSKEWLRLYRVLVPRVLETSDLGDISPVALEDILNGAHP